MMYKKKMIYIILTAFAIASLTCSSLPENGIVTCVMGDVKVKHTDGSTQPLKVNDKIIKGDEIKTGGKSFAVIQIGETKLVRIQDRANVRFETEMISGRQDLFLENGQVIAKLKKLSRDQSFRIKTPTTIAAVRGTVFGVSYGLGTSRVSVRKGSVDVKHISEDKTYQGDAGKTIIIKKKAETRAITEVEDLELSRIDDTPYSEKLGEPAIYDNIQKEIKQNDEKIDKKIDEAEQRTIPKTLDQIRQSHGRIDEIVLFSGKVYRGVIVSRGRSWKVLVPGGYIYLNSKQVRYTRSR